MSTYARERAAAIEAVLEACRLCEAVRAEIVDEDTAAKKDRSPVTVADYGAQALVNLALAHAFPDDPIVAEEEAGALQADDGAALRDRVVHYVRGARPDMGEPAILSAIGRGGHPGGAAGRFWTLDPIDGTKGFLRADQYAVALALIEDGRVVLGVLGCPSLPTAAGGRGCLFVAERGRGAVQRTLDDPAEHPVHATSIADPASASFCESVESGHSSHDHAAQIARVLGVTAPPLRMDSQCKYAAIARGDASIYLRLPTRADYQERIWDHAAGLIVVEEAGGRVSDIHGEPLDFSRGRTLARNKGVVASNGALHDRVISAIRQVLA